MAAAGEGDFVAINENKSPNKWPFNVVVMNVRDNKVRFKPQFVCGAATSITQTGIASMKMIHEHPLSRRFVDFAW